MRGQVHYRHEPPKPKPPSTLKVGDRASCEIYFSGKNAPSLREARLEKGMTHGKLAELVGCSVTHIGLLERMGRVPSLDILIRLCDELGCTPNWLLGYGEG